MLKHLKEYINFDNYDVEEYDNDIHNYINKRWESGHHFNYCIRVSEQDLDRLIDELVKIGCIWNSGSSIKVKHIFYRKKEGHYCIALFTDDLGRIRVVNADKNICDKIIDFR